MKLFLIAIALLNFSQLLLAETDGKIRMRARENYEWITIDTRPGSWQSSSFSHTLNLWYEKPFQWAIGLGAGPYVMSYPETSKKEARGEGIGESVKIINHGLEYKRWLPQGFFGRLGIYHILFNSTGSAGKDQGYGALLGFGYEHNFDGIGLALEIDTKTINLQKTSWRIRSNMVALGVHFYEFFD